MDLERAAKKVNASHAGKVLPTSGRDPPSLSQGNHFGVRTCRYQDLSLLKQVALHDGDDEISHRIVGVADLGDDLIDFWPIDSLDASP
jgi:hypothetical protein